MSTIFDPKTLQHSASREQICFMEVFLIEKLQTPEFFY